MLINIKLMMLMMLCDSVDHRNLMMIRIRIITADDDYNDRVILQW